MTVVDYSGVASKSNPLKSSTRRLKSHSGRNNQGRITTRHQGGGVKALYRNIDFTQAKRDIEGRVELIEYDPYRTAFIARIVYRDGDRRYILAPRALKIGDAVMISENGLAKPGNRVLLKNLLPGTFVHNVELTPGSGGKLARAAGTSLEVLANEDRYTHLKMPSGEIRKVVSNCYASVGELSNPEHNLVVIGKAGRSRWLGIRPTVRGKAMNPRDHPYGGGEGRTQRGLRRPKTKWGKITGGRKTRSKKKSSNAMIVKRRK